MDRGPDPASPDPASTATPGPDKGAASALRDWKAPLLKAGGIVVAAALAGLGSQFAGTIGGHLRGLAPQPELLVRVVPDGQFEPASPLLPFALVPASTGRTPAELTQADLGQGSLLDPLRRLGGIPASPRHLRLELRSSGGGKVVIRDIRADVVQRRASPAGWFLIDGGCGMEEVRLARVDLDSPSSRVRFWSPDSSEAPQRSRSLLSVSGQEVEMVEVEATTAASDLLWRLRLVYSGPAGDGEVVVDDRGQPFRTAGVRGQQAWRVEGSETGVLRPVRYPGWDRSIEVC